MLRNNSWIIDRISVIAEYYLDTESIQVYRKARKPRMHNSQSEGWTPYIPCTPSKDSLTSPENANIPENQL